MLRSLILACLALSAAGHVQHEDLVRAKTWKPRSGYRGGGTVAAANAQLNRHLSQMRGLRSKACEDFDVPGLRQVLRELQPLVNEELTAIYSKADGRRQVYKTLSDMEAHWAAVPANDHRVRDGHCHEAVMWFVHHLTKDAKEVAMSKLTLPKLPVVDHVTAARDAKDEAGKFYDEKVTCQNCHVKGIESLGAPEIKPTTARQRARRCYTNYKELFDVECGPCDGIAGKYWGDDDDKYFEPDFCTVIGNKDDIPESERVQPAIPSQFSVDIVGGSDRWGRTTNPAVSPKTGLPTFMNSMYGQITGKWFMDLKSNPDLWLLRHDTNYGDVSFNGSFIPLAKHITVKLSEIHSQTRKQQKANVTGPMVSLVKGLPTMFPGACTCVADPVGIPDVTGTRVPGMDGFEYLGRIKINLDEYDGSVIEVDHWYSWFFHIFMDVNKSVPWYGKAPSRISSGYSGTATYANWVLADPKIADPTVWYRGIPTKPMKVGPDAGQFCLNPKKVDDCNNITQTTFPPAPEAPLSTQEFTWGHVHQAFLPSSHHAKAQILDSILEGHKEVFV